jgi:hypothetical protein
MPDSATKRRHVLDRRLLSLLAVVLIVRLIWYDLGVTGNAWAWVVLAADAAILVLLLADPVRDLVRRSRRG